MKALALTIAAAVVGLSGAVIAGEVNEPTVMTDSQMDQVVGGLHNIYNEQSVDWAGDLFYDETSGYNVVAGQADATISPPDPPDQGPCNGVGTGLLSGGIAC